jgi:hypothetical protein
MRNRGGSSWRENSFNGDLRHPNPEHDMNMSVTEIQLLEHLRQLNGGSYTVMVTKTGKGRDGFHSFRLQESED